jgi:hypothetical protein
MWIYKDKGMDKYGYVRIHGYLFALLEGLIQKRYPNEISMRYPMLSMWISIYPCIPTYPNMDILCRYLVQISLQISMRYP